MSNITILRLGHRYSRDARISTHIALVARSFGAKEIVFDCADNKISESVSRVVQEWGGDFSVSFVSSWKTYIEKFNGIKIHLTMYGLNINDKIEELKTTAGDKLIIVGGKKVPSDLYALVDYNIAIGNQPHSEVAALAVMLDRLLEGKELEKDFCGKKTIIPQACGKKVV